MASQPRRIVRLHYNRQGARLGLPWTLHTSHGCHAAAHVEILVPIETEEKPTKRTNPRYFLKARARIAWKGSTAVLT
jgi:hypothetical protein